MNVSIFNVLMNGLKYVHVSEMEQMGIDLKWWNAFTSGEDEATNNGSLPK
jgi:hypothetical protein